MLKAFGEDATEMLDANIYNLYKAGISLADIEMNHEPSEEEKMIRSELVRDLFRDYKIM